MPTKDPHIAYIDAHEELERIKQQVSAAVQLIRHKAANGLITADDKLMIKAIYAEALDATKRVQERLYEELESHGKDNS